jgi:intergrase/recombinase
MSPNNILHNKQHRCPYCSRRTSKKEQAVRDYISTIYSGKVIYNERTLINNVINGKKYNELDIYIPDKNLAIEFDGLYWHSDAIDKVKKCW